MNKKKKFDPFENLVLDKYEQEIEEALSEGEFVSVKNFEESKKMLKEAAKRHRELKESKSITLRVKNEDLIRTKARAKRSQIAYQTAINLLINRYGKGEIDINI